SGGQPIGQPAGLLLGSREPAPRRTCEAAELGQPLGALGGLLRIRGDPPLRLGESCLRRRPRGNGERELLASRCQPVAERPLLTAQRRRLALKLMGVPAWPGWLGRR